MNTLSELLSSKTRAEVLSLLFGLNRLELHVREIARRSGCSEASVRQEMVKLTRLSLVIPRRDGNRLYYRADESHPLFPVIHELVLKTSGLVGILYEVMCDQPVDLAFVFGSVARGDETARSDVDLMVIGDTGLRELSNLLAGLTDTIGREINPHVMTKSEYRRRRQDQDHFTSRVLEGPKLFVIGNADELEAMGK